MLNRALELGATHMVTGHYAQVNYNEETGLYELHKGVDPNQRSKLCYVQYEPTHFESSHVPTRWTM